MRMFLNKLGMFFIISLLICSCSTIQRKLYAPTQINTPSLQKRNDHNFSITVSAPPGFDFHGSYALTNRIAILVGLYTYRNKDEEEKYSLFSADHDSAIFFYKHKGYHLGAGGYFPLIQDKSSLFISVFGTYTNGTFKMNETLFDDANPGIAKRNFYNSDIKRWALQSSLHFYSKNIHQALTTRYNYVGYSKVSTDYTQSEQVSYSFPPLGHSRWSTFLDFGSDTKIFFNEKQKVGIHLFGSVTIRWEEQDFNFYHYPLRIGIGLVANSSFSNKK